MVVIYWWYPEVVRAEMTHSRFNDSHGELSAIITG